MGEISTFFRHCPSCRKKFEISLVSEKLLDTKRRTEGPTHPVTPMFFGAGISPLEVEQNVPITVEVKDFQYTYRCKHCGHVWTELHEKADKA